MLSSSFATIFAQVTNAAADVAATTSAGATTDPNAATSTAPWWSSYFFFPLIIAMVYFAMIRPQQQAKKKADETVKGARTGDKIVTSSGIHGLITNVKDSTVIVKVADGVKLEIEKSHIDKITRPETSEAPEKIAAAKVS
jgi:preprotein translocase subunit YajC